MSKIKPFTSKSLRVQDYPDKAFTITLLGSSDTSKFKLNDVVYIVDTNRVDQCRRNVIGFDSDDGTVMLDPCAWCNTRGGYEDSSLAYEADVKSMCKTTLSDEHENNINELITIQEDFNKKYHRKPLKLSKKKELRFMYIIQHWSEINSLQ